MGFSGAPLKTLTPFGSASRLNAVNSEDQNNYAYAGAIVFINVSAITGAGNTLTVTVQGKDPVSGTYYPLLASAGLTATGLTVLEISPSITTVTANATAAKQLPKTFRVAATVAGTVTTLTYSVGVTLTP